MKKALALILTVAMLLSCVSMGVFAAREFSVVTDVETNKIYTWDDENHYVYLGDKGFSTDSAFTVSMDLRLDDSTSSLTNYGSNLLTFDTTGIGVDGSHVAYAFNVGEWYDISLTTDGSNTEISVNGKVIGTVAKGLKSMFGNPTLFSIDNLDCPRFTEDFEDGVWQEKGDSNGYVTTVETKTETIVNENVSKGEKTNKIYTWDDENHYVYLGDKGFSTDSAFTVSMDLRLDDATSSLTNYGSNLLTFNATGIGVDGSHVAYAFNVGEWYHISLTTDGSNTEISVNDQVIGSVAKGLKSMFGNPTLFSIDNLDCPRFTEDFEDGEWQEKGDSNGYVTNYKFEVEEPEPVDPLAGLPKYEVGGNAVLLESDSASNYFLMTVPTAQAQEGYISFDMAMIDNGYEGGHDYALGAHSVEFWRQSSSGFSRFTVGEKVGRDNNLIDFEWGELSAENFHNVVIKLEADANRGGTVYAYYFIDGVQVGAETGYNAYNAWSGDNFIMNIWNSSAIIDNFYVYDAEMNSIGASLLDTRDHTSSYDPAVVNLDYEGTYCAANGCVWGGIELKQAETCTAVGYDKLSCGECGEQIGADIERPMLCHIFNKFNHNNISDGYYYVTCKDCNETRYSKVPSDAAYEGDLIAYFDMSDDLLGKLVNQPNVEITGTDGGESWFGDNMRYENGKAVCDADSYVANYQPVKFADTIAHGVNAKDFSVSFDITVNGNYPWVENYENAQAFYFWMKGVTIEAGYDAVNKQVYIKPANGGAFDEWIEDYELVEGQTYNFKISALFDDEAEWGGIYVTIDNEVVIAYDDDNMFGVYYDMMIGEGNLETIYFRNMGVAFTMDNFVVGSSDFAWVDLAGDLDDNKAIDAADALTMRKFLAKVIGEADVDMTRMDVNGDDAINAKDQLAIRKALVA